MVSLPSEKPHTELWSVFLEGSPVLEIFRWGTRLTNGWPMMTGKRFSHTVTVTKRHTDFIQTRRLTRVIQNVRLLRTLRKRGGGVGVTDLVWGDNRCVVDVGNVCEGTVDHYHKERSGPFSICGSQRREWGQQEDPWVIGRKVEENSLMVLSRLLLLISCLPVVSNWTVYQLLLSVITTVWFTKIVRHNRSWLTWCCHSEQVLLNTCLRSYRNYKSEDTHTSSISTVVRVSCLSHTGLVWQRQNWFWSVGEETVFLPRSNTSFKSLTTSTRHYPGVVWMECSLLLVSPLLTLCPLSAFSLLLFTPLPSPSLLSSSCLLSGQALPPCHVTLGSTQIDSDQWNVTCKTDTSKTLKRFFCPPILFSFLLIVLLFFFSSAYYYEHTHAHTHTYIYIYIYIHTYT